MAPMTAYPGALANRGAPYLNLVPMITHGEIYYVHSTRGRAGNDGRDSLRPLATWMQAYAKCRANRGDTVVLLEGHTETITTATSHLLDTAGVITLACGYGSLRPTFTLATSTAACITVTAANNIVAGLAPEHGLIIDATGVDAVVAALNVQAADFSFLNCKMVLADNGGQAVLGMLTTAAASRMRVEGCNFIGTVDAGTATAIRIVGGDQIIIRNNIIVGAYTAALGGIENNGTACTDILVVDNVIKNRTANSTKAMIFDGASTGIFANNRLSILNGVAPVTFAAGSNLGGNYYSNADGVAAATLL